MTDTGTQTDFDYCAGAELFPPRKPGFGGLRGVSYRRFVAASDAIQFAMEQLPVMTLRNTFLQVGDERYDHHAIQRLYESTEYPNARQKLIVSPGTV